MRFGWLAAAAAMVCASQAGAVNYVTYEIRGNGIEAINAPRQSASSSQAVDFRLVFTVDADNSGHVDGVGPQGVFNYNSTGSVYTARYSYGSLGPGFFDLVADGTQSGHFVSSYSGRGQDILSETFSTDFTYADGDTLGGLPRALSGNTAAGTLNYRLVTNIGSSWAITGNITGFALLTASPVSTAPSIAAVPEPASWAMMIGGIGVVGGALRRKRGVAARHATA